MRANYHTHCDFCDGRAPAALMARAARAAGFGILGFSSHAPLPSPMPWAIKPGRTAAYAAEINRLKKLWAEGGAEAERYGSMEILLGLEIDWYPGERAPGDGAFDSLGLDYTIGSLHYIQPEGAAAPFAVDSDRCSFEAARTACGADGPAIYNNYYKRLGDLIDAGGFDILGHFDLVQKNNMDSHLFGEDDKYLAAAFEAVHHLEGRDCVVEINIGGMTRHGAPRPYPSLPILRELRTVGAPVCISADAHAPENFGPVGAAAEKAARQLAAEAGYRSLRLLSGGRWFDEGLAQD